MPDPTFWMIDTHVTRPVARRLAPDVAVLRVGGPAALRVLWRRHGARGALRQLRAAIRDRSAAAALVAGNLHRKAVRHPWLFRGPVLWAYGFVKRVEAGLVAAHLRRVLPPDGIAVIFNGSNFPESVMEAVSAEKGMPRVFTEAGFLPGTMQVDPRGLNAASSVPRDPAFYRAAGTDFAAAGLPDAIGRRAAKRGGQARTALPDRYVFVPFQVPSDMQVRVHSPWIRSMEQFLDVILDMARRNPDRHFVVKEHPSFRRPVDRGAVDIDRVIFANHNDTADLIAGAEAVVTLNSTVGLEALVMDRPVIVLAEAHYDIEGLVLRARDAGALSAALARLPGWRPDPVLRRQFLGYVRNHHLVPGSFEAPNPELGRLVRARASPAGQACIPAAAGPESGASVGR